MTPTQRAAIEKAAELFSRQVLGISAWGMTEAHEMAEALRAALAETAPPADVPMLTEDEIVVALHVALPSLSYDSEDAFINGVRAGEQAVRQKAGLP